MSGKKLPMIRLTRLFPLTDPNVPKLVADLGFEVALVEPPKTRPETKKKASRRRPPVALTKERLAEFRRARNGGKTYGQIAKIFGVTPARAWQIVNKGK